jgi:hypothetical protein
MFLQTGTAGDDLMGERRSLAVPTAPLPGSLVQSRSDRSLKVKFAISAWIDAPGCFLKWRIRAGDHAIYAAADETPRSKRR